MLLSDVRDKAVPSPNASNCVYAGSCCFHWVLVLRIAFAVVVVISLRAMDWRITASVRRRSFHPRHKTLAPTPIKVAHFGLGQSGFNLMYSLGALDQMDDVFAEKFVKTLAGHWAPGGQLFLCNWPPDTPDAVFQELMLSQKLHSQTLSDVERIAQDLRRQPGLQVLLKDDLCGEFCNLTVTRV